MGSLREEAKGELVERVCALVAERFPSDQVTPVQDFMRAYFKDTPPDDLVVRDPVDLYGAALAHLRFAERRSERTAALRLYNPRLDQYGWESRHTILEIVNDDMPFLVDSMQSALARAGVGIHLTIHPILPVERDETGRLVKFGVGGGAKESFIHIELDRLSDAERRTALENDLRAVLDDVRRAVTDWPAMVERMRGCAELARSQADGVGPDVEAFLNWLIDDHFTFLGYAAYRLVDAADGQSLHYQPESGLGLLRGSPPCSGGGTSATLSTEARRVVADPQHWLVITKARTRSTVHRNSYLDVIRVKILDEEGRSVGEHRFLGLFTSAAYSLSPREIPLLAAKLRQVTARLGVEPRSHAGKALAHILETYPRDELLQMDVSEITRIATGVLQLQERQQVRLFLRRDPLENFVSCLVYVPRDRYNTTLRHRVQAVIEEAVEAEECEFQVQMSDSVLARLFFLLRTARGNDLALDEDGLQRLVATAAYGWLDRLKDSLIDTLGEAEGNRLYERYGRTTPLAYQETVAARAAVLDVQQMAELEPRAGGALALTLYRRLEEPTSLCHFRIMRSDRALELSEALPILESMGLRVLSEQPFTLHSVSGRRFAIHDFTVRPVDEQPVDIDAVRVIFQAAFEAIWTAKAEQDGFNRLVLAAGLPIRDVMILRAYCKYLLQVGTPFSQAYIERALVVHAGISANIVRLFHQRFDPSLAERADGVEQLRAAIEAGLEDVQNLDEDRILRAFLALVMATTRTNAWQRAADGAFKDYLSFKLDPALVPNLPLPRPAFEIWLYSPDVEAVHLRGGKVARGGLRWSDRREDFRTEVLGLMKAQMVKNAVIVPVGAKGGFFVKRPPATSDRSAIVAEAVRCYRIFLHGMLDITDNREGNAIVPPPDVVRYDEDDPYLVVAADKGTATFSDHANAVSRTYGFWLDDAFASGGSVGYDHKAMAITARGAWESVKRHFRELGRDCQTEPFTCVGIGDMSGDVFGNGMLMSRATRLVAAFDHRHIFLDPNPDAELAFHERERLFGLARSSWADYDSRLISPGGGVYARTKKSIALSPEAAAVLGCEPGSLTPNELIGRILLAPVDLLWNGGIGTYVKAAAESQADAHDKTNDPVRVNGESLRAKIIGEGGNLGLTQRGRIAYAIAGGRLNTDFIDNSAGVDCSDHEVNIKILLGEAVRSGDLTLKQRDELLRAMTDEVAELVLRDNVLQNLALSMSARQGAESLDAEIGLMRKLEAEHRLDRGIETLPGDDELNERRRQGYGLTRPEKCVLFSYAKMSIYDRLLAGSLPDRPYFAGDLARYFPEPLRTRFGELISAHRLRREIAATWIANSLVNRGLHTFASEIEDDTGADLDDIALAYVIARDTLDLPAIYTAIEQVPTSVASDVQLDLLLEAREVGVQATRWMIAHAERPLSIRDAVEQYGPGVAHLLERLEELLPSSFRRMLERMVERRVAAGLAPDVARRCSRLVFGPAAMDIVLVAHQAGAPLDHAARLHFAAAAVLDLDWAVRQMRALPITSRWDRLAATGLEDQFAASLRRIDHVLLDTRLDAASPEEAVAAVEARLAEDGRGFGGFVASLAEMRGNGAPNLTMLMVLARNLDKVALSAP